MGISMPWLDALAAERIWAGCVKRSRGKPKVRPHEVSNQPAPVKDALVAVTDEKGRNHRPRAHKPATLLTREAALANAAAAAAENKGVQRNYRGAALLVGAAVSGDAYLGVITFDGGLVRHETSKALHYSDDAVLVLTTLLSAAEACGPCLIIYFKYRAGALPALRAIVPRAGITLLPEGYCCTWVGEGQPVAPDELSEVRLVEAADVAAAIGVDHVPAPAAADIEPELASP
jgi:hypothetical protein